MGKKVFILTTEKEGEQVDAIAFTANPAILTKGFAFSTQEKANLFFADEPKMRITAPLMRPSVIPRKDEKTGEKFEVEFTADNCEKIHQKFMQSYKGGQKFNIDHDSSQMTSAFLLETWIVEDPENDKSTNMFGAPLEKGTIMATAQFTDKSEFMERVKNGQTGFSVEGNFGMELKLNIEDMALEKGTVPFDLEDGIYTKDGRQYEVKDGQCISYAFEKEELKEEEKEPQKKEDEVELTEETPLAEESKEEPQKQVNTYTKEEVNSLIDEKVSAKIDEVLKVMAEKEAKKNEALKDAEKTEQKFNEIPFHQRMGSILQTKNN